MKLRAWFKASLKLMELSLNNATCQETTHCLKTWTVCAFAGSGKREAGSGKRAPVFYKPEKNASTPQHSRGIHLMINRMRKSCRRTAHTCYHVSNAAETMVRAKLFDHLLTNQLNILTKRMFSIEGKISNGVVASRPGVQLNIPGITA